MNNHTNNLFQPLKYGCRIEQTNLGKNDLHWAIVSPCGQYIHNRAKWNSIDQEDDQGAWWRSPLDAFEFISRPNFQKPPDKKGFVEYSEVPANEVSVEQADACAFVVKIPGNPDEHLTISVSVRACVTTPCVGDKQLENKWWNLFNDVSRCCKEATTKLMEERSGKTNESGQESGRD